MEVFDEGNGWRNEDTEGPYIDTLRRKADWTIVRVTDPYRVDSFFTVEEYGIKMATFRTIDAAKEYVEFKLKQKYG